MAEERGEFAGFVRAVPQSQLEAVQPLQLRRVFGAEEMQDSGTVWIRVGTSKSIITGGR